MSVGIDDFFKQPEAKRAPQCLIKEPRQARDPFPVSDALDVNRNLNNPCWVNWAQRLRQFHDICRSFGISTIPSAVAQDNNTFHEAVLKLNV